MDGGSLFRYCKAHIGRGIFIPQGLSLFRVGKQRSITNQEMKEVLGIFSFIENDQNNFNKKKDYSFLLLHAKYHIPNCRINVGSQFDYPKIHTYDWCWQKKNMEAINQENILSSFICNNVKHS